MRHLTTSSGQAYPAYSKLRYYGYTARNRGSTPANIIIHHGVGAGPALTTVTLAAKQDMNDWPERGGEASPNGLYVAITGQVELAVYFRA